MNDISPKILAIRKCFAPLLGSRVIKYQTAEIQHADGTWSAWPDFPIRLYADSGKVASIAWSQLDELWLSNDESHPFALEDGDGTKIRWIENGLTEINACLGRTVTGAMLGRGQMAIEEEEIEIWTRLVIELEHQWLEVFNALDENGYAWHSSKPYGEFVDCL